MASFAPLKFYVSIGKLNFRVAHQKGDRISFDSVGLSLILDFLSEDHEFKSGLLDFAPADNNVIQHFKDCNCIYYSSNSLSESLLHAEDNHVEFDLARLLSTPSVSRSEKQDSWNKNNAVGAILVWDLFNYLSRAKIIKIMSAISPICRKGTRLYALVWLTDRMPALPGKFSLTADGKIEYQFNSSDMTAAPILAAQTIVSMMPSFKSHRMSASDTGILEVILEFDQLVDPPDSNVLSSNLLTGVYH